jgi:hypothetical protein
MWLSRHIINGCRYLISEKTNAVFSLETFEEVGYFQDGKIISCDDW